MAKTVHATAAELRRIAELVDGNRGTEFEIVEGQPDKARAAKSGSAAKVTVTLKADSKLKAPKKKKLKVRLPDRFSNVTGDGDGTDYTDVFDALFWTESAIDKFLAPYYVNILTIEQLHNLVTSYYADENTIAFAHLPDSEPKGTSFVIMEHGIPGLFVVKLDPQNPGDLRIEQAVL